MQQEGLQTTVHIICTTDADRYVLALPGAFELHVGGAGYVLRLEAFRGAHRRDLGHVSTGFVHVFDDAHLPASLTAQTTKHPHRRGWGSIRLSVGGVRKSRTTHQRGTILRKLRAVGAIICTHTYKRIYLISDVDPGLADRCAASQRVEGKPSQQSGRGLVAPADWVAQMGNLRVGEHCVLVGSDGIGSGSAPQGQVK